MVPVEVSKERPDESAGDIDQEVTVPPLEVGVTAVIPLFIVKVKELGLYDTEVGAASFTTMVNVDEALPPELVAITVYIAEAVIAVGVPETVPVEVSKDRPDGSVGEIDQDTTVPPLEVGVTEVIGESFDRVNELGLYVIDDGATSLT